MTYTRKELSERLGVEMRKLSGLIAVSGVKPIKFNCYSQEAMYYLEKAMRRDAVPASLLGLDEIAMICEVSRLTVIKYMKTLGAPQIRKMFITDKGLKIRYDKKYIPSLKKLIEENLDTIKRCRHKDFKSVEQKKAVETSNRETMKWSLEHITLLNPEIIKNSYETDWFPDVIPLSLMDEADYEEANKTVE